MKYTLKDHIECRDCGGCKHWHEWSDEREKEDWKNNQFSKKEWRTGDLARGDCDKIPKGTPFYSDDGTKTYHYNGHSFEDECYDEEFGCFEAAESEV